MTDYRKEKTGYCPIRGKQYKFTACAAWDRTERGKCTLFVKGNHDCRHFARFNERDLECLCP